MYIYVFCSFSCYFFLSCLSFFLSFLGLGLQGGALQCDAGLDRPAAAVTGHALVPTPPASDKETLLLPSRSAPLLCTVNHQCDQTSVTEIRIFVVNHDKSDENMDTKIITVSQSNLFQPVCANFGASTV